MDSISTTIEAPTTEATGFFDTYTWWKVAGIVAGVAGLAFGAKKARDHYKAKAAAETQKEVA